MEHVLHIFGGGCGEHLIWIWIAPVVAAIKLYWFKIFKPKN